MLEIGTLLAHRGWDEILIIAAPVVVLYLGIRWWDGREDDTDEVDRPGGDAGSDDGRVGQGDIR